MWEPQAPAWAYLEAGPLRKDLRSSEAMGGPDRVGQVSYEEGNGRSRASIQFPPCHWKAKGNGRKRDES